MPQAYGTAGTPGSAMPGGISARTSMSRAPRTLLVTLLCMLLHVAMASSSGAEHVDSTLFGWQGEVFERGAVFGSDAVNAPVRQDRERWIETLSWSPRAFLFHNFLTSEEANSLIHQAAPTLKRSTVRSHDTGKGVVDEIRTSYGTFLHRLSSPTVTLIEERLANWTQMPIINQEDVQILRYDVGQKYGAHYDALGRICTVLIYLVDAEEGGETAFPKTSDADWADAGQRAAFGPFSECAEGHVAVPARKGDALLFYSLKPDGQTQDPAAMHTGCPLIKGVKWTATVWIHPEPFRPETYATAKERAEGGGSASPQDVRGDAGVCMDIDSRCPEWAAAGECEKNPSYMTGEGAHIAGACRLACRVCRECAPEDSACYWENRQRAGFLNIQDEVLSITGRPLDVPA